MYLLFFRNNTIVLDNSVRSRENERRPALLLTYLTLYSDLISISGHSNDNHTKINWINFNKNTA